jgi:c-di-GMP phosphodiesterase
MEVFIGRQPILNCEEEIVAYELLYRNDNNNIFPDVDSDSATIDVLVTSYLTIGINDITYGKPSFINFTENLIMQQSLYYLDPSKIVIELLEDIPITYQLIERIKELRSHGFKIALDDFVMNDNVVLYEELFQYIDYIKIDFLNTPLKKRMEMEDKIKIQFPSIKLLAEKVETREEYEIAKRTGYSLFQGYFFEEPKIIKSTDIPPNLLQYFNIIALLDDEEVNLDFLAESIEQEISLTYKLLQLINSSAKRTKLKVRSIKQAILLLGLSELRKWIYLLVMRETKIKKNEDLFQELMFASLFRAKICEKLARHHYKANYSEYFLVGLFSLIDTLLHRPMNKVVSQLPLSDVILNTISGGNTEMSPYLQMSIALSKFDLDLIESLGTELAISQQNLIEIYDECYQWAEDALIQQPEEESVSK